MEMNFPHDMPIPASGKAISLRKLDMDILRVLAFMPTMPGGRGDLAGTVVQGGEQALDAVRW